MALYLGNDEVSQRISLANVKGTNLPEITEETSGMFLSNNGSEIAWSEVETTVDTVLNGWSLLDHKFSDHILEDESWLRGDSFDWKDGSVYTSAYEHLLADYNNGEDKHDYRASNINIIGEIDDDKGIISGFSASNYVSMNTLSSFNNSIGSQPWEMTYKFNMNEIPAEGTVSSLIGGNGGTYIMDLLVESNGAMRLALSSNGSAYDIFEGTASFIIEPKKDYWVKLQFDGSRYVLSHSTDGKDYVDDLSIGNTSVLEPTDDLIYIGCRGNLGNPFLGSVDLKECYIKINGLDWWEGADSIKYRLSADGHKVCDYVQENAIQNVYELNGVAWYYIIDTANSKFKLPRSKWNFVGLRNSVGDYVAESLPNITGGLENTVMDSGSNTGGEWYVGNFKQTGALRTESYVSEEAVAGTTWSNGENLKSITFDASLSSSTYQDNAPVQQRATEMYLYFYVGDVVRNTSIINITQFGERMIEVENSVANIESTVEQHMEEVNTTVANIESTVDNKLDTTQITNCITEIPQDIKLELKDGSLTLKAGSKVYIPNGFEEDGTTKKFDIITIASDITKTRAFDRQEVWFVSDNGNTFNMWEYTFSGENAPTIPSGNYAIWYDTANNLVKYTSDAGTTWGSGFSLPVCLATSDSTQVVTLDQVFNGFGYIGSTIFALPGVKGLIPNGRNEDGSLKNIETISDKVLIYTNLHQRNNAKLGFNNLYISPQNILTYNELENINLSGGINPAQLVNVATWSADSNNVITSFTPKLPFRAVDQNDKKSIVNWFMPNYSKAIDVTFVPSGTWTAPSDGYVIGYCYKGGSFGLIVNEDRTFYIVRITNNVEDFNSFNAPVVGGQTYYMEGAGTHQFKFVPCRGI